MNDPKRWSDPASDVDPVLRSVLRYARLLEPEPDELQSLVRGAPARAGARRPRRAMILSLSGFALLVGSAAWAAHSGTIFFAKAPAPTPASLPPPTPQTNTVNEAKSVPAVNAPAPVPAAATSATTRAPASRAAAAHTADSASAPAPSISREQDAALLQQARAALATDPARALTLTRDHAVHFPDSALGEERQALHIEALARLGRTTEAVRDLAAFDAAFPRSPYARRLHTLLTP